MITAIEWLELQFEKYTRGGVEVPNEKIFKLTKKALLKEKEQIKRAFEFGVGDAYNYNQEEGEEYYNQTYNKEVTALENK